MTKEVINAHYYYNEANELIKINIHFLGQDSRYSALISYITIYSGSPVEFYNFLNELDEFWKENDVGTSMTIHNHHVTYDKLMGAAGLWVSEEDGSGYRSLNAKHISKFKQKFVSWCEANNVVYTL